MRQQLQSTVCRLGSDHWRAQLPSESQSNPGRLLASEFDDAGQRGLSSRWIGDLALNQYRWIICVGPDEASMVRSALGSALASVMVANEHHGGIPDPYGMGLAGYRDCLALLDQVMPQVAARSAPPIKQAPFFPEG